MFQIQEKRGHIRKMQLGGTIKQEMKDQMSD